MRAGYIIVPIAITVTGLDPEIAAKNMQPPTVAMARPPGSHPTRARANATSRFAMSPALMMAPDTTKNGIASKTFLSASSDIFAGKVSNPQTVSRSRLAQAPTV